ncbi:hypothetical protein [Paraburkholderia sp. 32]|uniref:hypothetical protein n=1 Tax=Paraburkholderia sp. 32 TaxID=2991057 RepID=UPI003D23DFBB
MMKDEKATAKVERKVSGIERLPTSSRRKEVSDTIKGAGVFIAGAAMLALIAPSAVVPGTFPLLIKLFVLGLILRIAYIHFPQRAVLHRLGSKTAAVYRSLATFQKLYVNVGIVSVACFLLGWLGGPSIFRATLVLMLVFWGTVAVYDVLRWYRALSDQLLGKAAIGLAFVAASNLAYALAGQEIASVVHVVPTGFTHATLFIALAMIPVLLIFAGGFVSFACLLLSALVALPAALGRHIPQLLHWLLAGTMPKLEFRHALVTRIFQVLFYGVLGTLLYTQGERGMPWYDREMSRAATWLVFNFDMFEAEECKIASGDRLMPLGDAKFLVAKKSAGGDITFGHPVKCDDLPSP